jgi:hypothetical protein
MLMPYEIFRIFPQVRQCQSIEEIEYCIDTISYLDDLGARINIESIINKAKEIHNETTIV